MTKVITTLFILFVSIAMQPRVGTLQANSAPSLAERLGFKASDKILIVNVDDVGNSHAANAAVIDSMENGLATSSTIIVPGPWFPEIAAYAKAHPASDFGVHLCHTSEWKTLKWGPIANKSDVPGLVDPQGYLWPDTMKLTFRFIAGLRKSSICRYGWARRNCLRRRGAGISEASWTLTERSILIT